MAEASTNARRASGALVGAAVNRSRLLSSSGIAERTFTLAFSGLVYPQIWEDPEIDMEALAIEADSRIVAIASGSCNVLSYLTAGPAHITAVDLNVAHVALSRLKLAAAVHLPDHAAFYRFFGEASTVANVEAFDRHIAPALDADTLAYWSSRDWRQRRRIEAFARNFYRCGLLGRFITAGHLLARRLGADPAILMQARTLDEQRDLFERHLAPLFDKPLVRWIVGKPASLYGLGIPPAQYAALAADGGGDIVKVLRARLERLACGFPLEQNYFARQAFGRGYGPIGTGAVPPYLTQRGYEAVRGAGNRVSVRHVNLTEHLAQSPDASLDRYVLLDAQDWMSDADLTALWRQITRTARPKARVIFRTAAEPTLLPGRVPQEILGRWRYEADRSREWTARDRSAIYGGFHLYVLQD